jgi:hypothetical protein
MIFNLNECLKTEKALRRKLASPSGGGKLAMFDDLRKSALVIRMAAKC